MIKLIKKYKNRRLYDTQISQYITLEDLQRYVLEGVNFRIEDSSSGKNLTNNTLLQILIEMENGATQFFSPEVLRQLISMAHHPMSQSLQLMLEQSMALMDKQIQATPYILEMQKAGEAVNQQMQQFFKHWQDGMKKK